MGVGGEVKLGFSFKFADSVLVFSSLNSAS
jgi:hypothetical protein